MSREVMEFDIVIVGAGPAGLSAAIRLAQLSRENPLSICLIEKGAAIGSHILSGAVLEPYALDELIPDWKNQNELTITSVTQDQFCLFTEKKSFKLPTPPPMRNNGNFIISLGQLCRWLGKQAETLGINIFPGFAATEIIYENDSVRGIITGDKGLGKNGQKTQRFQSGYELRAKQTLFAEGCRGSLTETLFARFNLRENSNPQTYGLGMKELWEIPNGIHQAGTVMHSIGWPLDTKTYGGSFVYHFDTHLLAIGFVVGLDYQNPYLNPYEEFQQFKTHPAIYPLLTRGKRIAYGARSLNEGGYQSIPKLNFPGGVIVGCGGGLLNVPKIKGIHNAMKSGMIAAENIFTLLKENKGNECIHYSSDIKKSKIGKELHRVRNIRPAMTWGLWPGLAYAALDTYLLRGKAPWTLHYQTDYSQLKPAEQCKKINYPKHDNLITFDLMSSVYLTHLKQDENQPCHLHLKNKKTPIDINLKIYAAPEQRYCPAGVYEIQYNAEQQPYLQINSANCIHCKACDIKDPTQNIVWTPPEGGSGPGYEMM